MFNSNLPLQEIIEWDVPNWSRALPFWERYLPPASTNPKILALGERNGGLSLWLALKGYRVTYSDIRPPTPQALELHKRYGVSHLIDYMVVDAFNIPFEDNSLDVVVSKSTLGGIKLDYKDITTRNLTNQKIACNEIRRVLKPNGYFLGAENTVGSKVHQFYRSKQGKYKGWRYLSQADLGFMFADYTQIITQAFGFLPSATNNRTVGSLVYAINLMLTFLLPASTHYISFIAAKK